MGRFDDRVAIVTGAGSGTGAAIAARLAEEGASVVGTDLDGAVETAPLLGERGRAVRLDVADAGSVGRMVAEPLGRAPGGRRGGALCAAARRFIEGFS